MRYIVNGYYLLIGYRDHRYGLSNRYTGETCFFNYEQYELIRKCDGRNDLDPDSFSQEEQDFFTWLLNAYFIRPARDGEELSVRQQYRFYPNIYKDNVQLSITGRCNCRCRHCFISAPHARFAELSFTDCLHILDQLERCGVRRIGITGGEPLIHPCFRQIIEELTERGLVLNTLYTNGLLFNDEITDLFKRLNQSPDIQISFDGLGTHDWLRGIEGSEKKAIEAISRSVRSRFITHVSLMLYRDNLAYLMDNIRFLDSLGVSSIRITPIEDLGEWHRYQKEHGLSDEEAYETYLRIIPEIMALKPKASVDLNGFFIYDGPKGSVSCAYEKRCSRNSEDRYLLCKSLKNGFYINSDGILYPCVTMIDDERDDRFSILKRDLSEILDDEDFSFIADQTAKDFLALNEGCWTCEYRYMCLGGCRAKALSGGNGLMGIDPKICAYFRDGWKKKKDDLLSTL